MQADHNNLPASGAPAAGKPFHALPQSSAHTSDEEVRNLRATQAAPAASILPEALLPTIELATTAHQPLHFLLQTTLVALAPFAELMGMRDAVARAADWGRK